MCYLSKQIRDVVCNPRVYSLLAILFLLTASSLAAVAQDIEDENQNGLSAVAPANDGFASPQVLSGTMGSVTGNNIGATKEPGEPNHAPSVSLQTVGGDTNF